MIDPRDGLADEITLDEAISLLSGHDTWSLPALPDRGIPALVMTDGPTGARGGDLTVGLTAACFPAAIALAASWDRDLARELGVALGHEARTKRAHVLLGPTVNLVRAPLAGRNFETYGEDPELSAALCVGFIEGVQSTGVAACVKHLVANDQEADRMSVSVDVEERVLRELYLRPFEAAVEAGVWSVMSAYNRLGGVHASHHLWLLRDLLVDEWGFDGAVISDWGATHGPDAVSAGLTMEMPGPPRKLGDRLRAAVAAGEVAESDVREAARRVLRLLARTGAFDEDRPAVEQAIDDPAHRALARRVATAGTVCLANDGILPLDLTQVGSLALIGPNADPGRIQGGGSSQVRPHHQVTIVEALTRRFPDIEVTVEPGCTTERYLAHPDAGLVHVPDDTSTSGWRLEVFADPDDPSEPVHQEWSERAGEVFMSGIPGGLPVEYFLLRWTGVYTPEVSGTYEMGLASAGFSRVRVDGNEIIDNWTAWEAGETFFAQGSDEIRASIELSAGVPVRIEVELARCGDAGPVGMSALRFGLVPPRPTDLWERAIAAASAAEVAVVVVGLDSEWETEGTDRVGLELPGRQAELVAAVAAANPRTVVLVNAGSPVSMPWLDEVPATLIIWYPGQEMGDAVVDLLSGQAEPAGRLPVTFPRSLDQGPVAGDPARYPGVDGVVHYDEGTRIGHRWYTAEGEVPLAPFGAGQGYTRFTRELVDAGAWEPGGEVSLRLRVTNVGERAGREVIQVYARRVGEAEVRLVAFDSVTVEAGQQAERELVVEPRRLARWTPGGWVDEAGPWELIVADDAGSLDDPGAVHIPLG